MSTPKDAPEPSLDGTAPAPEVLSPTRPFLWSLRREFWENRSLYLVPLFAAGLVLFSYFLHAIGLPARLRAVAALDPVQQQNRIAMPFSMTASVIILTTMVVGAFYCLEALYGERRDRSILFWKSLPVSDRTAVLAKLCVPLVALPVLAFTIALATQLVLLALNTLVLLAGGFDPTALWTRVPLLRMTPVMAYGLAVHALWYAPIFGWLLLVSAWARRLPLLWAVLPPVSCGAFERLAFGTQNVCGLLGYRFNGALVEAFDFKAQGHIVPVVLPLRFLGSPGLWAGLVFAAIFVVAAVRLRRYRGPI